VSVYQQAFTSQMNLYQVLRLCHASRLLAGQDAFFLRRRCVDKRLTERVVELDGKGQLPEINSTGYRFA